MRFLVAVDGSRQSEQTIEYAVELAEATGASVTLVYAVDPEVYSEGGMEPISSLSDADQRLIIEDIEDAERRAEDVLDEAVRIAENLGVEVETETIYGDPVVSIPSFAESEGYDNLFVGHQGRSERTERVIGSVAKGIVERSSIPVTVVR
ncbi:universal stress protein [Salinirarus marinus]|uniref:universal stress protein n=2 Tax=Haloferacaceae TaxID=1644056 RepID=UPI003C6C07D9